MDFFFPHIEHNNNMRTCKSRKTRRRSRRKRPSYRSTYRADAPVAESEYRTALKEELTAKRTEALEQVKQQLKAMTSIIDNRKHRHQLDAQELQLLKEVMDKLDVLNAEMAKLAGAGSAD